MTMQVEIHRGIRVTPCLTPIYSGCGGCFFDVPKPTTSCRDIPCVSVERTDRLDVIFKECTVGDV